MKVGDTIGAGPAAEGKIDGTFTVKSIKDGIVYVSYTGTRKTRFKTENMGQESSTTSDQKVHFDLQLNLATRLVISKESVVDGKTTADISGDTVPTSSKATETIKITKLN